MNKKENSESSQGTLHVVPKELRIVLMSNHLVKIKWDDITPLARNEWICWIISAKKQETKDRRMKILCAKLLAGDRRPCCWAGCTHR